MCGADRELVAELERLVSEHPLPRAALGIPDGGPLPQRAPGRGPTRLPGSAASCSLISWASSPSPDLQRLERAVLEQDPDLEIGTFAVPAPAIVPAIRAAAGIEDGVPAPARLITEGDLPFCGRQGQIDSMLEHLKVAANGELKLVLVSGEAGIGKTRLAAEVARRALDRGSTVLYGRCDEGLAVPFQPFVEALTQVVRSRPASSAARSSCRRAGTSRSPRWPR